jgi:putative intracellular protease/amidase
MSRISRSDAVISSNVIGQTLASTGPVADQSPRAEGRLSDNQPKPKTIGIVLFPRFETLDVFGPVEMWGHMPDYALAMVSEDGRPVMSSQGVETVAKYSFENAPQFDILMVPGGGGTRTEVDNTVLLNFLRQQDKKTEWTTSVCTGSALLARAGILDGRKATTNKRAYAWATSQSKDVHWQSRARWVVDGKYMTSSGVSAGMDMALCLVEMIYGKPAAQQKALGAEYVWNKDPHNDPFADSATSEMRPDGK